MVVFLMNVFSHRRSDIEKAKGLAILFVVFGHIVSRTAPPGVDWYEPIRRAVYTFHMPFFLYLSGMVAVLSGALFLPPKDWPRLCRNRARRLLVPFFGMGVLIVCGKVLAEHFVFVDNRPASLLTGLADLVWHTGRSNAISVWYLFVLFVLSVCAPLLIRLDRGRLRSLTVLTTILYVIPMPQYCYLDHIGRYAIFFALGALAGRAGEDWSRFVDRFWPQLCGLLLFGLCLVVCFGKAWPEKLDLLPLGVLSMPALHGLVRNSGLAFAPVLLWLGRNSFMIYLFNTICIGLAKGVLFRVTTWNGDHFLPFAALLMASGSIGPIMLRMMVPDRIGFRRA